MIRSREQAGRDAMSEDRFKPPSARVRDPGRGSGSTIKRADADPLLSTLDLGVGVLCSVLGGYVCERIARRRDYKAGAVLAALSAVLGLAMGAGAASAPMLALLVFLTVGSVLLGTRLGFAAPAERSDA